MKTSTARRLIRLNRIFYDSFAGEFSASRRVLQPGIPRALRALGKVDSLLDLGCGDGRVLGAYLSSATTGRCLGIDSSSALLSLATKAASDRATFICDDIAIASWSRRIRRRFDAAICFSVLHHIPGARRRLRLLRELYSLLRPGALCALSVWRFQHVPRLMQKTIDWEEVGLDASEVDVGDYLLDWQRGGRGLRYVHHFDEAELTCMCRSAGFTVADTYHSDGETGDMALYMICEV